jgi:hypothetical protein
MSFGAGKKGAMLAGDCWPWKRTGPSPVSWVPTTPKRLAQVIDWKQVKNTHKVVGVPLGGICR